MSVFATRHIALFLAAGAMAVLIAHGRATAEELAPNPTLVQPRWASIQILRCGYIRRDIASTLFAPDFVGLLARRVNEVGPLRAENVREAVLAWNERRRHPSRAIAFEHSHFVRLASLADQLDKDCQSGAGCLLEAVDLAVLEWWLRLQIPTPDVREPLVPLRAEAQECLNVADDPAVEGVLRAIAQDPVGCRLLSNAAEQGIAVRTTTLQGTSAYFECGSEREIVIDPTVTQSVFKIGRLVHELVHAANPTDDNSITEEALAEILAMRVQDRISGVPMSCHPYVVFVDRLLDDDYGRLPVNNDIEAYLEAVGIRVSTRSLWE